MARAKTRGIPRDEKGKLVFTNPILAKHGLSKDVPRAYPLATKITCRCGKSKSVDIRKRDFHCKRCGMFVPAIGDVAKKQGEQIRKKYGDSWQR